MENIGDNANTGTWTEETAGIFDALEILEDARRAIGREVYNARMRDASWSDIGAALGISRQGAWEQWKDVADRKRRGEFDAE